MTLLAEKAHVPRLARMLSCGNVRVGRTGPGPASLRAFQAAPPPPETRPSDRQKCTCIDTICDAAECVRARLICN